MAAEHLPPTAFRCPAQRARPTCPWLVLLRTFARARLLAEHDFGPAVLTGAGRIVRQEWLELDQIHAEVTVDAFTIWPDHLCGVLWVDQTGRLFSGSPHPSLRSVVHEFRRRSTTRLHAAGLVPGGPVWQVGFDYQVIREESALERLRQFITRTESRWVLNPSVPAFEASLPHGVAGAPVGPQPDR